MKLLALIDSKAKQEEKTSKNTPKSKSREKHIKKKPKKQSKRKNIKMKPKNISVKKKISIVTVPRIQRYYIRNIWKDNILAEKKRCYS